MRLLRRSIRGEQRIKLTFAVLLMAGGTGFGYIFFEKRNILATLGLAGIIIGLRMLWEAIRQPKPEDERLWQLLRERSRQIVWIYSVNTQTMPFGFHLWDQGLMYFHLSDGEIITLSLPTRKLKMVSKFLNRLLPFALFGYSPERQQMFEADPLRFSELNRDRN